METKEERQLRKRKSDKKYRMANREKLNAKDKEYRRKLKIETFNAYGGCFCVCCGEHHLEFLQLDHTNNNGAKERKENKCGTGPKLYIKLKREGFPPGYQVLCANCNFCKRDGSICPHKLDEQKLILTVAKIGFDNEGPYDDKCRTNQAGETYCGPLPPKVSVPAADAAGSEPRPTDRSVASWCGTDGPIDGTRTATTNGPEYGWCSTGCYAI
jgi:hypothetical protein